VLRNTGQREPGIPAGSAAVYASYAAAAHRRRYPAHHPHRRVRPVVPVAVSRTTPVAAFADVQNKQRHPIE
ncbi:MAG: hypothetical protein ACRDRD_19950, partial [Pseudonocardiaceae bacterium]